MLFNQRNSEFLCEFSRVFPIGSTTPDVSWTWSTARGWSKMDCINVWVRHTCIHMTIESSNVGTLPMYSDNLLTIRQIGYRRRPTGSSRERKDLFTFSDHQLPNRCNMLLLLKAARTARTESNLSWSPIPFSSRGDKWTEAKIVKMAETAKKDQTLKQTLERKNRRK
jgi:hypothetical protein